MQATPPSAATHAGSIPVLLLKTKSCPTDSYEDLFATPNSALSFSPRFVPIMEHKFVEKGMREIRVLLRERQIGPRPECRFGGLIFTSQRAVEAFAGIVRQDAPKNLQGWPHLQQIPIYSVGPATTRALGAVAQQPPLQIFGSQTGNGDALAKFILQHYREWYSSGWDKLPPLLFLVGERRRDIISRTLADPSLPDNRRIETTEEIVYETGAKTHFLSDFVVALKETNPKISRWIVVFSPMGCDSMLRGLGILDESTGKFVPGRRDGSTFVATIGPTTKNHLLDTFGFEPDVCAETPTPDGILNGIARFEFSRVASQMNR